MFQPTLEKRTAQGIGLLVDPAALDRGVVVGFADRHGGVSAAPYDSLNLAARGGDDKNAVAENRARVASALGFDVSALALARQVHGADLLEVASGESGVRGDADVLATSTPGCALGILTADCTPVVVAGTDGVVIAHAGWRGLVAGAVERAVERAGTVWGAWVGPSIRACCYEVGPEVIGAFEERGLPVAGPDRVDPRDAALAALRAAGVNDAAATDVCTFCDKDYFSYRRDNVTGRQGAFVALQR